MKCHYTPCELCLGGGGDGGVREVSICPSITFWSWRGCIISTAYWQFLVGLSRNKKKNKEKNFYKHHPLI